MKLRKILILTSIYLPHPSANGINTKYIIDEFKKRGYEVSCIGVKENNEKSYEVLDDTHVYRVSSSIYSKVLQKEATAKKNIFSKVLFSILHLLRKIKLAVLIFNFPNFDLNQSNKVFKLVNNLNKKENFECIIGVFQPYSNIAALTRFKKKNPDILCGAYFLDLTNSIRKPSVMPKAFFDWLCKKSDIEVFRILDFLLIAKSGRELYKDDIFIDFRTKIKYIDFPTFISTNNIYKRNVKKNGTSNKIVFTYAGTLDVNYRNPTLLLRYLDEVSKKIDNIQLNIYGRGNCDHIINEYTSSDRIRVVNFGTVTHNEALSAMVDSDILVNISNSYQHAVPSKIFEMFSFGKPIINFVFDKNDVTKEYFDRYPLVFNLRAWEKFDSEIERLIEFINKEKHNTINTDIVREKYFENTPEFTVKIIEEFIFGQD